MKNTPSKPPVAEALPAAFWIAAGGCRLIAPNSTNAKNTNPSASTVLVTQWLAKAMITGPTAMPMSTNISTMPMP